MGQPKRPRDANQRAYQIVQEATRHPSDPAPPPEQSDISAAAAALGRLGGKKGGPARMALLSAEQRHELAKKAAHARWSKGRK